MDPATGAVSPDDSYDGPQIVKIRVLQEAPYLEIYWDRYVDENAAVDTHNYNLHVGEKTILLKNSSLSSGSTDTLYLDRQNSAVAASEAHCMDRLDEDLHMSSIRVQPGDVYLLEEAVAEGLTLEVTGSAITDAEGKPAKDAVYTGIPQVPFYTQFLTSAPAF